MSHDAAASLAEPLRVLADATRLRMLSAIAVDRRGETSVQELVELTALSQPTVSHHLRVMREVGLLESTRRGTSVWYRIARARSRSLTALFDALSPIGDQLGVAETVPDAEGLATDAEVTLLAERLSTEFPGITSELVFSIVRESAAGLLSATQSAERHLERTEQFARERLTDLARDRESLAPQVLFLCSSNRGRSQLAAALLHQMSYGRVVARSAGFSPAEDLPQVVRACLTTIVGINDAAKFFSKPLTDDAVRAADVVVTFGGREACPTIAGVHYEEWLVGDPVLASREGVESIRDDIAHRVRDLLETCEALAPR